MLVRRVLSHRYKTTQQGAQRTMIVILNLSWLCSYEQLRHVARMALRGAQVACKTMSEIGFRQQQQHNPLHSSNTVSGFTITKYFQTKQPQSITKTCNNYLIRHFQTLQTLRETKYCSPQNVTRQHVQFLSICRIVFCLVRQFATISLI